MSELLAMFIIGVCILLGVVCHRDVAIQRAFMASLLLACLVHAEMTRTVLATYVGATLIIHVVAWIRARGRIVIAPILLMLFLTWWLASNMMHSTSVVYTLYSIGSVLSLMAVGISAMTLRGSAVNTVVLVAAIVLPIYLILSVAEMLGANAVYPRRDGHTFRLTGANSVLPFLHGRSMATTGYAITLGVIAAALTAVLVHRTMAPSAPRWLYLPIGAGIVTIVLSGTRTAIIGLVIAVVVILVLDRRTRKIALWVAIPAAVVAGILGAIVFIAAAGTSSESWTHRLSMLSALGAILARPPVEVLFGSGFSSVSGLFAAGVLNGSGGLHVVDDDYLRILVGLGLIGLLLLAAAIVLGLLRGRGGVRPMLIVLAVAAATYDVMTWRSLTVFFVVALATRIERYEPEPLWGAPSDGLKFVRCIQKRVTL